MPSPPPCFHSGANCGYLAVKTWLPDEQIALAILANDQATDVLQVASGVRWNWPSDGIPLMPEATT